jgi:hypothetical protein
MAALAIYMVFFAAACAYAGVDWRRAWFFVPLCGVLQDPVRKLTPNTPVAVSFAVVGLFAVILFSARDDIAAHLRDFVRRFPNLYSATFFFLLMLIVAAFNGLFTYGFDKWKVPLLSFTTYVAPLVAILFGYTWLQREEMLYRFWAWYSVLTSVALIGTVLEHLRVRWAVLGMVGYEGDILRYMPGIQIRLLSGFYRSPDIMAWHAATLAVIGISMALRQGLDKGALLWSAAAGWGFFNCMIAGRRKAIYYVLVFVAVFLWRYLRRVRAGQLFAMVGVAIVMWLVVRNIALGDQTSVYAETAIASSGEIAGRLEGGVMETFRQFGYLGAGLGTATQGVRHLLGSDLNIGWQEGGLGKLAMEVGLPGMIALLAIAATLTRLLLLLTRLPDVEGSSQFIRAMLFALVAANAANFIASAQAYSDAILALLTGFFVGCLFATAALDERLVALQAATPAPPQQLTSPAPA